jgi:hypothetical protein
MASATLDIIKTEGPSTLLSGLGPTVVGYGIEGAMKFGIYEVCKPIFKDLLGESRKALAFILASMVAGAVAALLLCPMESLRIRQVTDSSYAETGLLTGLPKLIGEEGLGSLFGGVWAMLAKQVCCVVCVCCVVWRMELIGLDMIHIMGPVVLLGLYGSYSPLYSFIHSSIVRFLIRLENKFPLMSLPHTFTRFSPVWEMVLRKSTSCWSAYVPPLLPVSLLACSVNRET